MTIVFAIKMMALYPDHRQPAFMIQRRAYQFIHQSTMMGQLLLDYHFYQISVKQYWSRKCIIETHLFIPQVTGGYSCFSTYLVRALPVTSEMIQEVTNSDLLIKSCTLITLPGQQYVLTGSAIHSSNLDLPCLKLTETLFGEHVIPLKLQNSSQTILLQTSWN